MKTFLSGTRRPAARVAASIVCLVTLSAFTAACGSTPKDSTGVASIGTDEPGANDADSDSTDATDNATDDTATDDTTDDTGDDTDSSTPDSIDPEDAFNEYTECMRDNGIDLPDAQVASADSDGNARVGGGPIIVSNTLAEGESADGPSEPPFDPESEEYQEAEEECQPILEAMSSQIEIDPEVEAEHREQMLDFAKCMREHGIDFPDPTFSEGGGGGVSVQIGEKGEGDGGPDFDDEAFQEANKECGEILGEGGPMIGVATNSDGDS